MKIPSETIGLYNAGQDNRHFDNKVKQVDPVQQQGGKRIVEADKNSKIDNDNQISTTAIFSNQELVTLKALFGYENQENFSMYGRNKIHNVQAGMLLDIKG